MAISESELYAEFLQSDYEDFEDFLDAYCTDPEEKIEE